MIINNNGVTNNAPGTASKPIETAADQSKVANPVAPQTDSVKLSAEAQSLSRLQAQVADASDVDSARVDALRQAINEGSYQIDPDSIATKMLASDDIS